MSNADEGGVPLIVFVIVIFSAFIHASWNLATRAIKGDLAVLASSCFFGSILLFPAIFFVDYSGNTINLGVAYGFISGVVHIVYIAFVGLMYAHASGNISVVYPIARGTGVCLTAIFARPLLGETISLLGFFGILIILVGISLMAFAKMLLAKNGPTVIDTSDNPEEISTVNNYTNNKNPLTSSAIDQKNKKINNNEEKQEVKRESCFTRNEKFGAIFLALILGCIISSYSIIDKVGVGYINPVTYIWIMEVTETCFFVPYFLCIKTNFEKLKIAFKEKKKYILVVTVFKSGCYLMVLYALTLSKASYITALRECSVVFGAILGIIMLKENYNCIMAIGIISIVFGLVMIKYA